MSSFQIISLSEASFAPLFSLSDQELAQRGARRVVADEMPGYPCRVSLVDAEVGEELLLLPYAHQPADSPYKASGPIFVRKGAQQRVLQVGEVPQYIRRRLISIRAYDAQHMMIGAEVRDGQDVAAEIQRQFDNARVAYFHLHNAKPGCYSCLVKRA